MQHFAKAILTPPLNSPTAAVWPPVIGLYGEKCSGGGTDFGGNEETPQ